MEEEGIYFVICISNLVFTLNSTAAALKEKLSKRTTEL